MPERTGSIDSRAAPATSAVGSSSIIPSPQTDVGARPCAAAIDKRDEPTALGFAAPPRLLFVLDPGPETHEALSAIESGYGGEQGGVAWIDVPSNPNSASTAIVRATILRSRAHRWQPSGPSRRSSTLIYTNRERNGKASSPVDEPGCVHFGSLSCSSASRRGRNSSKSCVGQYKDEYHNRRTDACFGCGCRRIFRHSLSILLSGRATFSRR